MAQERRQNPRFACDLEASVVASDGKRVLGRTADLSYSGICVFADKFIAPGERVTFDLRLLLEWAESDVLQLPGVVVWCTPTQGTHQLGARFDPDRMNEAQWDKLDLLVRFLAGEISLPQEGA